MNPTTYISSFFFLIVTFLAAHGQIKQFDCIGDIKYSKYNFTDLKSPYNGFDGWSEFKGTYWLDKEKSFAAYVSLLPAYSSDSLFWWQNNIQIGGGIQWYPFADSNKILKSIRLHLFIAYRYYWAIPKNESPETQDVQFGADYYLDNLFDDAIITYFLWSNLTHRKSNFSIKEYNSWLWMCYAYIGI